MTGQLCICGHHHDADVVPFAVTPAGCTDETCECQVLEPVPTD